MSPLFLVVLAAALLLVLGCIAFVALIDRNEEQRRRWPNSVPTITQLPRASVCTRKASR